MSPAVQVWVPIKNDWKEPKAIQCQRCYALCASADDYGRHLAWHENLHAEMMASKWRSEQGQG